MARRRRGRKERVRGRESFWRQVLASVRKRSVKQKGVKKSLSEGKEVIKGNKREVKGKREKKQVV